MRTQPRTPAKALKTPLAAFQPGLPGIPLPQTPGFLRGPSVAPGVKVEVGGHYSNGRKDTRFVCVHEMTDWSSNEYRFLMVQKSTSPEATPQRCWCNASGEFSTGANTQLTSRIF
jgi:hypothetical protein